MTEIDRFQEEIEKQVGTIEEIIPIEKGFSSEKKFKLVIDQADYLARISPIQSLPGKTQEFNLMRTLFDSGVRCNQPSHLLIDENSSTVCTIFGYLAGVDAEEAIAEMPVEAQYEIGVDAGRDLKRINSLRGETSNWKERKQNKHERYVRRSFDQAIRFKNDKRILRFIETHYDRSEAQFDTLQHDDFHLANIVINSGRYAGVLDFNRYDWGDPLHEFVKLEWFNWPVSQPFVLGQIDGYFGGRRITDDECLQIAVYIAMSIFSTAVWTLENYHRTWPETEASIHTILAHFDNFERIRPLWAE